MTLRLLASAAALAAAIPAHAQTAQPPARTTDNPTVTALIRLLVGRGTISQSEADALIDAARSQAASLIAASAVRI